MRVVVEEGVVALVEAYVRDLGVLPDLVVVGEDAGGGLREHFDTLLAVVETHGGHDVPAPAGANETVLPQVAVRHCDVAVELPVDVLHQLPEDCPVGRGVVYLVGDDEVVNHFVEDNVLQLGSRQVERLADADDEVIVLETAVGTPASLEGADAYKRDGSAQLQVGLAQFPLEHKAVEGLEGVDNKR